MTPSFSVVIISYNGKDVLKKSLVALDKSIARPQEIIVVDDASSDGTEEMIRKEFPLIRYVQNDHNSGTCVSRNHGAHEASSEYLVFLDNDILVRPDAIGALLMFLEMHSDVGLAGGKLITSVGMKMRWNMGYPPSFVSIRRIFGAVLGFFIENVAPSSQWLKDFSMRFTLNYWDYDHSIEVGWVAEGFNAIKRELFERVGGFDERIFMSHEGPELSDRLRAIGYKTYFVHNAVVDILESHSHSYWKRMKFFYSALWYYRRKRWLG